MQMGFVIFIVWLLLVNLYEDYLWPITLICIFSYLILKLLIFYIQKLVKFISENIKYGKILKNHMDFVKDIEIRNYEIELGKLEDLWNKYENEKVELKNQNGEIINICEKCGSYMKIVKWRGNPFLGCSNYPHCKSRRSLNELYNLSI